MTLPGTVQSAPSGQVGFDTDTVVSASLASTFYSQGYHYVLRYVSLGSTEASGDLTATEATNILNAGLGLMPVQHVRAAGWSPSASLGTTDGTNAANHVSAIGFPAGVNVWMDLEGVSTSATIQSIIDYSNAWYDAVNAAGFVPGIYVGYNSFLSADQLYYDLKFQHYWKSGSSVPTPSVRGYQMIQSNLDTLVNGIYIDRDTAQTDALGGTIRYLKK